MSAVYKNKNLRYGSGRNAIDIDGLYDSTLTDSGGNNKLSLGETWRENAVEDSSIILSGKNTVTGRARESVLDESSITFNHGGNTVNLKGGESALDESRMYFKGGGNTVSLSGTEDAVSDSAITAAGGNKFAITATGTAMDESSLSISGGSNSVTIKGKTALEESRVTLGGGSDSLSVTGAVREGSIIDTGSGNDRVYLNASVTSSAVRTGSGNDSIRLYAGSRLGARSTVDGGSGTDTLDTRYVANWNTAGLASSGATVKSVEILNMEGGSSPAGIHVTGAGLARITPDLLTSGLAGHRILRIRGNADDRVTFASTEKWAPVASGGKPAEYTVGGVAYNLWKNATGQRVLVEQEIPAGYAASTAAIAEKTLNYSADAVGRIVSLESINGYSLKNGVLKLGSGADTVKLSGKAASSTISLGGGDDSLTVGGAATGRQLLSDDGMEAAGANWIKHVAWTNVSGGDGNDSIVLARGADNGTHVNLGEGRNSLTSGADLEYARVTGGSGNDTLQVKGEADDILVNLGNGANRATFFQEVEDAVIQTGTGSDSLAFRSSLEDAAIATGGGNDKISAREIEDSTINLGTGHDSLTVAGNFLGSLVAESGNDSITIGGRLLRGSSLSLGEGGDALSLESMSGGRAYGGNGNDELVLKIDSTSGLFSANGEFFGLFSGETSNARDFESLILDMRDSTKDTLTLTRESIENLKKVSSSNGTDSSGDLDLWVSGDTAAGIRDSLVLESRQSEFAHSGSVMDNGVSYNHYAAADGLDLYIQLQLAVTFGG